MKRSELEFRKSLQERYKSVFSKKRQCMFDNCNETAINSHVLQRNGILSEIAVNQHLITPSIPNPFDDRNSMFELKLTGINEVFSFYGFCKHHDNEIFKEIEDCSFNPFSLQTQLLISYRGLCQEIRRKEIAVETLGPMQKYFPKEMYNSTEAHLNGLYTGILHLSFYKDEFEKCIKDRNYSRFVFKTVEIPRIDICISVPLNIKSEFFLQTEIKFPMKTSFVNIIPYNGKSFAICGYHKNFSCGWTKRLFQRFSSGTPKDILKEISDLITLRLEFWAMSPELFNKIDSEKILRYRKVFEENAFNHVAYLKTDLNLFEGVLRV